MADSRSAHTWRRLTGGVLLALCVGFGIERAGAQQQGTVGTNVNVISGTGSDGDWTLQRQNEPSMACSSRNPQNCLAGANDYRTVDIPFPDSGEKITGDAWLGWYTTKNGGLTWRTRLLPGYPQDGSVGGMTSPLKGYPAGADPIVRSGTNGMFYYGGLVFNREEGQGSTIFVARFIDNNNQEGVSGEPIAYIGASVVHRIGAAPTVARSGRGAQPTTRIASAAERAREERARLERMREHQREEREREEKRREGRGAEPERRREVRSGVEQSSVQMVDKPWMAVDIPRAGATMCTIGGAGTGIPLQTFPGGRVYMAYALFDGPGEERGRIMLSYSADCARTWSPPRVISRVPSADVNDDGVASTADVSRLQLSMGRSCGHSAYNSNADINNDCVVNSLDLGLVARAVGLPVPSQPQLSQGAALAIDPQTGTLHVAWRQFADGVLPDAIVAVRSTNGGATVSGPTVVATLPATPAAPQGPFDQGTTNTSFRTNALPSMTVDATGRAYIAWASRGFATQRPDATIGDSRIVIASSTNGTTWTTPTPVDNQDNPGHQLMPALTFGEGKLQVIYYDLREDRSQLFGQFVDEDPIVNPPRASRFRHTIDVRGAQADPGPSPTFSTFKISQYKEGDLPGTTGIQQLEFSPPNLPLFQLGTTPFMGDYIDTTPAVPFVRNGDSWSFNTAPSGSPTFHAIWTDNRDIRPPADGNWRNYTAPNPPFGRPALSRFDSSPLQPCIPGQAGMKNQNIYTTRITQGLVVGALGNSRQLSPTLQRSFPVFAQNNSAVTRTYRLTIANQPVGGSASFGQFQAMTTLDVSVPARSTIARTVFVTSTDPKAQVRVNVVQVLQPNGEVVPGGQQGTVVLNPDPTNPDIANPDIANPDIANPDIANPDIANPDIANPDIANAEVYNPDIANAATRNPDIANPDIANPDIANPDIANITILNPDIANPDIANPDIANPDIANPDIANPDIANPDIANGSLSDTTWFMRNTGNAAASFTVKLAVNAQLPPGFKSQLIAHKIYKTPVALGCDILTQPQTVLLANIPNPTFVAGGIANPDIANPDIANPDIANLTIALAPGDTARITLRVVDPNRSDAVTFNAAAAVTPAVVAQAVNTPDVAQGIVQPTVAAPLSDSAPVPGGTSGGAYTGGLQSTLPGTWTPAGGTVPPGLTINQDGTITGTPTTPGTYTFTARFTSTNGITDLRTVTITVGGVGAAANVGVLATGPTVPVSVGTPFAFTINVNNAGPAAATNVQLTDTLPAGTQFVSATTSAGACQHTNGRLLCALGTLNSGATATIVLNVQPTVAGSHTNQAVVTADQADPVATNNTAITATSGSSTAACPGVCFSGPKSFSAGPGDSAFNLLRADFNNDGNADIVFTQATASSISVLLGDGAGNFGIAIPIQVPGVPGAVWPADFNNDGNIDIVVAGQVAPQVWIVLGNGLGGFTPGATITLPAPQFGLQTGDFNRDGNIDIVLGGNGSGALVTILIGNGTGTFQAPTGLGTTTVQSNVIVEDFNNDGNPDLAARAVDSVVVYMGDGEGGFSAPLTTTLVGTQRVRKVGDLNRDGLMDLVVGYQPAAGVNDIAFLPGNGAGGFGTPVPLNGGGSVQFATSADFDSDGDLDLVWVHTAGGFGVQANDGQGNFAAPVLFAGPFFGSLMAGDFNNDGLFDVAGAGVSPSAVVVYLNTCGQPPADLALTVTGPVAPVAEGVEFAFNVQIVNNGPNAATEVQLEQFGVPVPIGAAPAGCTAAGARLTCQLGTLESGGVRSLSVTVRAPAGGNWRTLFGVSAATHDPVAANNTVILQTNVTAIASTFVVTNTNSSGPGSLRDAITNANSDAGPRDTITFSIPGPGPHVIRPTQLTPLPAITQSVVIDATTQPGYVGFPVVEISGENGVTFAGLTLQGSGSVVRGLAVTRFQPTAPGISLGGAGGHTLESNFIGTNGSGASGLGNSYGVHVASPNNVIGGTTAVGNLISGNSQAGVAIFAGANGTVVAGNHIGVTFAGTSAFANGGDGVYIRSSGNTIGGTAAGAGNVISGNQNDGIDLDAGANNNVIVGNRIGTNAAGTVAIPNAFRGIWMSGGATGNTIGGASNGARNLISGNNSSGISLNGAGTSGNTILGNFIGTNAAGTAAIPNAVYGVDTRSGASGNMIGGAQTGEGNVLSGNLLSGVAFLGAASDVGGNTLVGNLIGTDASGTAPIGNTLQGVFVQTSNNRIGSVANSIGNTIAFNGQSGVRVESGTGNAIVSNSIHSNASLGIDLLSGGVGVTPNDPGDTDTGPNNLQNFPVLSSARLVGSNALVQVNLTPPPAGPFVVQFFVNPTCTATVAGAAEGATLIGTSALAATTNPTVDFEASFSASAVPAGSFLTATATDAGNNTSEFSTCVEVAADAGTADVAITKSDTPDPTTVGQPLTYTLLVSNLGPEAASNVVVTDVLPANVTFVSANATIGACTGTSTVTCTIGSIASGANVTIGIVVTPTVPGTLTNTASVTSSGTDTVTANNSSTTTTTVVADGPMTFVVTSTGDTGPGTLRQAIADANAHAGSDAIAFNIAGSGVHTITPATNLPTITGPTVIDATTQPGYTGLPLIELSGANAPANTTGLFVTGANSVIRGLIVNRFTGTENTGTGIIVGIAATGTRVEGNWVGLSSSGAAAAGNGFGVIVRSPGGTVGGTSAAQRNVISGNTQTGLYIQGTTATGNTVQGNYIGTDVTGQIAVPNLGVQSGIHIQGANNLIGGDAGGGNVVSGNQLHAITISTASATGNIIAGNLVGVAADGDAALGNGGIAVDIVSAPLNQIGLPGEGRNLIANNGLAIQARTGANGVVIRNNLITGNSSGIRIEDLVDGSVGGLAAGDGNVIENNAGTGILLLGTTLRTAIRGNSISGNSGLGIDLAGIADNDAGDTDNGPNNGQNFPVITSVATNGSRFVYQGWLTSTPNTTFRIELFSSPTCDASGRGEGATFIAATTGSTNNAGLMVFENSVLRAVAAGAAITATATDSTGNTSEFSACATAAAATLDGNANLSAFVIDTPDPVQVGNQLTYTITVNNSGPLPAVNAFLFTLLPSPPITSATSPQGVCSVRNTSAVECALGTIANGGTATVTIVATPATAGVLTFEVLAVSALTDPSPNISQTVTTVTGGASTFVVTNTSLGGIGSLHQAITDANANANAHDTITFNIPGPGPYQIQAINLPTITDPVTIDGTTQPGWTLGTPVIELTGAEAPQGTRGLVVNAGSSTIRGLIINRFPGSAIVLQGGESNTVVGNWIGLAANGSAAAGNSSGISIISSGNSIGGTTLAERNVISGNEFGVRIGLPTARGNVVIGNYIGTDASGTLDVGNTNFGVDVIGEANVIGGPTTGAGNVISGNNVAGISLDEGATANTIVGNRIGLAAGSDTGIPNGIGVHVENASSNTIGGLNAADGNTIAFNTTGGIVMNIGTNNAIWRNAIHSNGALGIDLGADGVTTNDVGDTDEGANERTNFPVLTGVSGGVQGTFNGFPLTSYRIEFFGNNTCDTSGHGEGTAFLGSTIIETDGSGNGTIAAFAVPTGQFVTATATDGSNNTSEFSACVQPLAPNADLSVSVTDSPDPVVVGTDFTYTVTVTNNGPSAASNVRISTVWNGPFQLNATGPPSVSCEFTPLLTCVFGSLASGASAVVNLTGASTAIGTLGLTVTLQADQPDPVPGNNAVAVNTSVIGGALSFVVSNTSNSGNGSLRQAILNANASVGLDTITFNIAGAGPHSIAPTTFLPDIVDPVVIDGTTQPGYAGTPLIELNGANAGATSNGLFIRNVGGSAIRGLAINRFGVQGSTGDGGGAGIVIQGPGNNVIERNFIGTDPTGLIDLGNRADAIFIDNSPNNVIGGPSAAARNVLSGNDRFGLMLNGTGTTSTIVQNNLIGPSANGAAGIGNGDAGIAVFGGSQSTIGGTSGGLANTIAFNVGEGIHVSSGTGNAIVGNSIAGNGGLGIDLGANGIAPNIDGDADTGANQLQNFPVLTTVAGGVSGTLNSLPNTTYRIEFFGNAACDASGNGEGATFLGSSSVATNAGGTGTIATFATSTGQLVTATATDPDGNTSEFSACVVAGGAPAIASIAPQSASQNTTLNVVITGQNTTFAAGTTNVTFGAGITVNSLTVSTPTSATANITVSPTAVIGGRTVTATTASEIASGSFSVTAGTAALTTVAPNSAQQGQANLTVAITGANTHFAQGTTTASFGGGVTVNTLTINSPTTATANITLENFAAPGLRDVTLSTGGEHATLASGFNVIAGTPRISSVAPASAQQGQTVDLVVTGLFTNFVHGTTTASVGTGVTVNSITVTSPTAALVNVTIAPLAAIGQRTVTLNTLAENASSLEGGSFFTVARGAAALGAVTPATGRQAQNLTVTVTGTNTHFATGSTAFSFGSGITVTSATINSPTTATVDISIAANAATTSRTVTATTLGEIAEIGNGFTVSAGLPTIHSVTPASGRQAERLNLTVAGLFTNWVNNVTIASLGSGIVVNAVTVTSPTSAVVDATISPAATLGARTVVMTTGNEVAEIVGGFTVSPGLPTLFSISPVAVVQGLSQTVILNGAFTNFTAGQTTAFFGSGITVGTVTVNGPTLASVPITVSTDAAVGARTVTVTTGSEVIALVGGFTVLQGTPTIASINPNAAQRGLTRDVTITGVFTNWQPLNTSVSYGAGVTVNSNVVHSTTSITTNITIDPGAALGFRDVVVTTGAEELTVANGFAVTDVDTTNPTLLRTSPAASATGVPLNPVVTAEFSEPLRRESVSSASVQFFDNQTNQEIPGTVELDVTGRVVTFEPHRLLAVNRSHRVSFVATIEDVAGNNLANQSVHFTTGFSTDTTGPTLQLASPQNGDIQIPRNVRVVLQFDRPINTATLGVGLRLRTGGVTVPGTLVLEDQQRRVRFTPATPLNANSSYVLTLTSEIRDVAGNVLTNPGTIVFETSDVSDTTAPTVTATSPRQSQENVGRTPVVRVSFSEPINPITLNPDTFYLYYSTQNAVVPGTIAVSPDRRSATLTPLAPLAPHTLYQAFFSPFADLAGNTGGGSLSFYTGSDIDTLAPSVLQVTPANLATNIPVNTRVRVILSEPIDATLVSLQLTPAVAGTLTLNTERTALLFTPSSNLATSSTYTVHIGPLRDASGNTMGVVTTTFTTSSSPAPDTTAPTVVSWSPTNTATGVPVNTAIVLTVSEPIQSPAFLNSMRVFANIPGFGTVQFAGTYTLNPAGTVVTFTPQVPYPAQTAMTVYSNYDSTATDMAGNALQYTVISFTTASEADTTPPSVLMVSPVEGAAGIGPAAEVAITFSEPLNPATVSANTFSLFAGPTEIGSNITRSADNTTVFLAAHSGLPRDALITVVATSDVTDLSGNALADFSSTFTTGPAGDTVRPQILAQRPTGPGIPPNSDVTLISSKPLNAATVPGALFVAQNGVLVEGTVTLTGGGTMIRFSPTGDFEHGAAVQVFMTTDAQDEFGNAVFAYNGSFTIAADPSTQALALARTFPAGGSSGHPTNAVVDIDFNKPLLESTVTSANLYMRDAANLPVTGTLSVRNGGRTVRFTPSAPLAPNNYNYLYLTDGLRDLQNSPFAGTNFYFYTGASSDTVAPTVEMVTPPNGATDIGINAPIRIRISEPINPLTATLSTLSLTANGQTIPASVTYDTTNRLIVVVPQIPLPVTSTITLLAAGLEDAAGNRLADLTSAFTTRTAADTVPPTVITTNLMQTGATNVPIDSTFQITFSEPMEIAGVLALEDSLLWDYGISSYLPGTATITPDGLTLTFVPSAPLAVNRQHGIFLSGALDLAGNAMTSFSQIFTTSFAADTTPPTVVAVNPVNGSANVPRNARVEIRFNESISAQNLSNIRLLINGGTPVSVTRVLSDTNRVVTLRPSGLLTGNRNFTISVSGVRDTRNNLMVGTFTSTFSTGSTTDLIAPTITSANPPNNATGVGTNVVARVTFSEPIDPVTLQTPNFQMWNYEGGDPVDATLVLAVNRRSATLTPAAPLQPGTRYYFTVTGFTDGAGNTGSAVTTYFYTGVGTDTTPPGVYAISPPDNSSGLPVNARVVAVMTEAIDPTSVSNASIQLTPNVPGTVTLGADFATLTLTLSANLATSTTYSVLVSGLRDSVGNTMSPATFDFTTGALATPDTTPPTVVSRNPPQGAAGVPVSSSVSFTTSERITTTAVGPGSVYVSATVSGFQWQLAGTYTVDPAGTTVTFTPVGAFPANATIRLEPNRNGAIRDMAGLALQNVSSQFVTENVVDNNAPTVQAVTPENGAVDQGQYTTVTLTFSESVRPNTVNDSTIAVYAGATRLSVSFSQSLDNRMVSLGVTLPGDATITVFASGVLDLTGNTLVPFSSWFRTASHLNSSRASVISQRPTGSGVSSTSPITLFVNKALNPATVEGAVIVSQDGVVIPGTVSVEVSNRAVIFAPAAPFAPSASIEIALTSAARDFDGLAVHAYRGTFVISPAPAGPPTLLRTTPVHGTQSSPSNTIVELEFSKPLNPATVTPANVYLRDAANLPVSGTLSLRAGNRIVRFTPASAFATAPPSNWNYVYYTSGLQDEQGNAVAGSNFWFYYTAETDSTAPTVTYIVPSSGTSNVGVNSAIRVSFSETVNPLTLAQNTVSVVANGAPISTTMSIASGMLTVTPQRPLPANSSISVLVSGVEDSATNAAPVASASFTTGVGPDFVVPTSTLSVAPGETGIAVNATFQWHFSEPIDPGTLLRQTDVFWSYATGTYISGGTLSISQDLRTATYVPPANANPAASYWVGIGSVADLAGNVGGGASASFTTSAATDNAAPQIVATSVGGLTGVPLNARIRIAFDEPVSAAAIQGINVLVGGTPLPITNRTLSDGNRVVTVVLASLLTPNAVHSLAVAGVRDRAGNQLSEQVIDFTTGAGVDIVAASSTITTSPVGGATGVPTTVAPTVTYNEPIDPTTVLYAGISSVGLEVAATSLAVPVTYSFSSDRRTVTLTPLAPLAPGTQYRLRPGSSMFDLTGRNFPFLSPILFTTAQQ